MLVDLLAKHRAQEGTSSSARGAGSQGTVLQTLLGIRKFPQPPIH